MKKLLTDTDKIHQILALVDVDFSKLFSLKIKERIPNHEQTKFP
jgi:hypothetical protein